MLSAVTRPVQKRAFSVLSKQLSSHGHEHHEGHEHDDHHGHHEEFAPEENLLNPETKTVAAIIAGTVGTYYANKSWEAKFNKSILESLMGSVYSVSAITQSQNEYSERVAKAQSFFRILQLNQPERKFHEFKAERIIPTGSSRSLEPGASLDISEIGPRRARQSFFKEL